MRQPINSDRRLAFVKYIGSGLEPYEAYRLAGFSVGGDEKSWKANCRSLCGRLRSEIDAARAANGLAGSKKQVGDLSDDEVAELLAQTREALKAAQAQNNVGATTKLLRQLERLTRKSARGRTPATTQQPKAARVINTGKTADEIIRLVLGEEECAAIDARYAAFDEARARWLKGEVRDCNEHLKLLPADMQLETQTIPGLRAIRRNELTMSNENLVLGIDARGATEGAAVYTAAIAKIDKAITRLDRDGTAKLQRLQQISSAGGFSALSRAAAEISAIKVSPAAARNISALSTALGSFKPVNRAALKSLGDLYMALVGLQRIGANPVVANTLANLRGPSPKAIANLQAFSLALQQMQAPRNAAQIIATLNALAAAADRLRGVGSTVRAIGLFQNANNRAAQSLRNLGGGFGYATQMGSLFNRMIAGAALLGFTRGVMDASASVTSFRAAMSVVIDDAAEVERMLSFVNSTADRLGLSLQTGRDEFARLGSSMLISGRSGAEAQRVFEVFGGTMRVLNLSAERQGLVFNALSQIFSKGRVSSEELRQQLGESLPGAFQIMEQALTDYRGHQVNLNDELERGTVSSEAVLLMTERLAEMYGDRLPQAMSSSAAQFQRVRNGFTEFLSDVGAGGLDAGLADAFREVADVMAGADFKQLAADIGQGLGDAARTAGSAFRYLVENADAVLAVGKAIVGLALVKTFMDIGLGVMAFARSFAPLISGVRGAVTAMGGMAAIGTRLIGLLRLIPGLGTALTIAGIGFAALEAGGAFSEMEGRGLSLGDKITGVLGELAENFRKVGTVIATWASDAWKAVSDFFKPFGDVAAQVIGGIVDGFRWLAREAGQAMSGFSEWSGWNEFMRGATDRAVASRDGRERAQLRGRSSTSDSGFQTAPTDLSGVNPFGPPRGNAGAGAERAAQRRVEQQREWVRALSPASDMLQSLVQQTEMLERATVELTAAGLTRDQALARSNDLIRESAGLLSVSESAHLALARAQELNAAAASRGLITAERQRELDEQARVSLRDTLGFYSERERALNAYRQRLRDLQDVQAASPELSGAVAEALQRETYALLEQFGAINATTQALHNYAEAMADVAAVQAQGADGSFMRRQAGSAAMGAIAGDDATDFQTRVRALQDLAAQGAITAQQYRDSMASMTASTLEFQVATGNGTYVDQFLAGLLRMTEGARNMQVVMGDLMTEAAASITSGIGDSLARAIVYAEDLQSALYDVVNQALASLISGLIQMGIQMLINQLIGQAAQTAATSAAATAGATVASAWSPAAAAVSLASFGSNAAPAMLGIGATYALTAGLSAAGGLGMKDGGLVVGTGTGTSDSVPRMLSAGEMVINAQSTAQNFDLLQRVNNGASPGGAGGGAASVEVDARPTIINNFDPAMLASAMTSEAGKKAIINTISDNSGQIRRLLSN